MPRIKPTEEQVLSYFTSCSNWGRWGADDELGTVNFITPERRRAAGQQVREGIGVSCAQLIVSNEPGARNQPVHYMTDAGERWAGKKNAGQTLQFSKDFIGLIFHGTTVTHIDSLAHIFWNGKMYNDKPAERVTTSEGATIESVDAIKDGIVTRGVLLDMPRLRGKPWLDPGEPVYPEDLEEAETAEGVRVQSGDVLLVRYGNHRRAKEAPELKGGAGMQAAAIPWMHKREIAVLGSDGAQEVSSGYPNLLMPVHQVGIVAMGLWLLDNANLEELAEMCARLKRWEFMLTISPLRFQYATGSPVNPTAIF